MEKRKKGFTPTLPPKGPHEFRVFLDQGFKLESQPAIRVFMLYVKKVLENSDMEKLMRLEYLHAREETFKDMGDISIY